MHSISRLSILLFVNGNIYEEYGNKYKRITNTIYQNISSNNRTQGTVEQNFREAKQIKYRNRRFNRLDEFVRIYADENKLQVESLLNSIFQNLLVKQIIKEDINVGNITKAPERHQRRQVSAKFVAILKETAHKACKCYTCHDPGIKSRVFFLLI